MRQVEGRRILVVEDELMVAMGIEMLLIEAGCTVVGPHGRYEQALLAARTEAVDGALIDVNLRGNESFPVADILAARGIPFAFLTGYGRETLPERFAEGPLLAKPCQPQELLAAVKRMCDGGAAGGPEKV